MATSLDPNNILVAIPATIAAFAALAAARRAKHTSREVTSPNGTSTAQAVQDIKTTVGGIAAKQVAQDIAIQTVNTRVDDLIIRSK